MKRWDSLFFFLFPLDLGMNGVCVVVGVGPGIGQAVASKFASEGFAVALVGRTREKLERVRSEIQALQAEDTRRKNISVFPADASNEQQVKQCFADIRASLGVPTVLVYNAAARRCIHVVGGCALQSGGRRNTLSPLFPFPRFKQQKVADVSPSEFEEFWRISCLGAFLWYCRLCRSRLIMILNTVLLFAFIIILLSPARVKFCRRWWN